jgi:hypothetical protein
MVQWDGKYAAVGDQEAGGESSGVSAIYQTTGASGKIVHETPLDFPGGYADVLGSGFKAARLSGQTPSRIRNKTWGIQVPGREASLRNAHDGLRPSAGRGDQRVAKTSALSAGSQGP